ncbi:MAG: hypothetical protein JNL39_08485 [Opitutaceae bacterium]|nr:hypothetical protein [Opitutaceae bacterium]
MNEHDIASNPSATAPASSGSIPGQARVEHLGAESGARIGGSHTQTPWGAGTAPARSRLPASTFLGDAVGHVLGVATRVLNPSLVQNTLGLAKNVGHYAVLVGGGLTLAYAVYAGIERNSFAVFAVGLGLVAALAVAQYAAMRFLDAADTLISNTPGRVSSSAFLECTGLLVLLAAVAMLATGIGASIRLGSFTLLIPTLVGTIVCTAVGAIALHPALANTHPGTGGAGEEAVGLLSFAAKAGLKIVPIYFGLLALTGALAVLTSFFSRDGSVAGAAQTMLDSLPVRLPIPGGQVGTAAIITACLIPIAAYAGFLLYQLSIDLVRAVLSLPGKLDSLRR